MKDFIYRLSSRKFLLTVAGAAALLLQEQYTEFMILVLGYVGVEGGSDIVAKYKSRKLTAFDIQNVVSQNDNEREDIVIAPGKSSGTPLFDEKPTE